jgi:hypothetical protein
VVGADDSRTRIHAAGLPCSGADIEGELVSAAALLRSDTPLCTDCVARYGLPSVVDLQALASAPETVLILPQGRAFHRDDGNGRPRCRAAAGSDTDRQPRRWPLARGLNWREPCGRARCFGGEARTGAAGRQPLATDGGQS